MRGYYNRLSFQSGVKGVYPTNRPGGSLRSTTDRSDLPFPKEMVQREAERGSRVESEIQVGNTGGGGPMVLGSREEQGQHPKQDR